jgi:hypothetical protein
MKNSLNINIQKLDGGIITIRDTKDFLKDGIVLQEETIVAKQQLSKHELIFRKQ